MVSRRMLPCLTVAMIFGSLTAGHCTPADRADIQSAYARADDAANRKDAHGAADRFGDPALKAQAERSLSGLFQAISSPNFTTRIVSFAQNVRNPAEAVVVIRQHFQGVLNRHGQAAIIASDAKFREYWTHDGGQWHTMRSRLIAMQRTLNGHPVKSW